MRNVIGLAVFAAAMCGQAQAQEGDGNFVIVHKAGPRFSETVDYPDMRKAHRDLYVGFAESCKTLFGGRFAGDTPLGFTVFVHGVDEAAIKTAVEADPAITGGFIALEYRYLDVQFGDISPVQPACKSTGEDDGS